MRMRKLDADIFKLEGGLDLVSIPAAVKPGRLISAVNFEPDINGGYKRIPGIERFDGRPNPSDATYSVVTGALTGPLIVGNIITGVTSGATAVVTTLVSASKFVVTKVVGTFVAETFNVSGVAYGTITTCVVDGESNLTLHGVYTKDAATQYRNDILVVPGSGYVRGVVSYLGERYAFRDNAVATACIMYKATTAGWVTISFGKEIQFTGAVGVIAEGATVVQVTTGATGIVKRALLRTGTWTASGVGTLVFDLITGTFDNFSAIQVGGVTKVTASSLGTDITLRPGGKFEFTVTNVLSGAEDTERLYCADGVNFLGEFDGTRWVPIRTGAAIDNPKFIKGHKNHLIVAMGSSMMASGTGAPYSWTLLTGASELATGQAITGLSPEVGDALTGAMLVLTDDQVFMLYGSDTSNFALALHSPTSGGRAYTLQNIGMSHFMGPRGITQLAASQAFGNFNLSVISNDIQPLIDSKLNKELCSTIVRLSNQYRIFFSDGTAIIAKVTQGANTNAPTLNNFMLVDYGSIVLNTVWSSMGADGLERVFGAGRDGYVYELDKGTSLDGASMRFHFMTHFSHKQSLRLRKNYHRTVLQLQAEGHLQINLGYDLGFGKRSIAQTLQQTSNTVGGGAFWDQLTEFIPVWDTPFVQEINLKTPGNGDSISLILSGNSDKILPFTVHTAIIYFKYNRVER